MNTHRTDLSIDNLQKAFGTAFTWVVERDRESGIDDFAGAWVDLLASALQDVRLPPAPVRGRRLDAFCQDLASGWTGDPALSGMESSAILDEVMTNFQISHILRIRIVRENPEDVWRPVPLPL